jgi:hypothetical protein
LQDKQLVEACEELATQYKQLELAMQPVIQLLAQLLLKLTQKAEIAKDLIKLETENVLRNGKCHVEKGDFDS